jgi:hypothetical protein
MRAAALLLITYLLAAPSLGRCAAQDNLAPLSPRVETNYNAAKDETSVKLPGIKLGGEKGKYHSLHSVVSFKYPGQVKRIPEILTFELITVVKARRLKVDLYVQFLVDGEKIFLSSNRWAERNPVPGKPWVSEHIALRMPFEIFEKITKAKEVVIQMDAIKFTVGNEALQVLREFHAQLKEN